VTLSHSSDVSLESEPGSEWSPVPREKVVGTSEEGEDLSVDELTKDYLLNCAEVPQGSCREADLPLVIGRSRVRLQSLAPVFSCLV